MSGGSDMSVDNVLETCLYVDDLLRAEAFYGEVLGLKLESRQEGRHVFFHCGRQMLLLFNPLGLPRTQRAVSAARGFWTWTRGIWCSRGGAARMDGAAEQRGVPIEKTIDWPGGGRSVYFRDPAGNSIELATPKIWGISERFN